VKNGGDGQFWQTTGNNSREGKNTKLANFEFLTVDSGRSVFKGLLRTGRGLGEHQISDDRTPAPLVPMADELAKRQKREK
jgi:hypothetical protein